MFPNIDAIFGLLGGTTAVVISFIAPALFWERFVGFMYPWRHPRKLFARVLLGFAALVAALSLPSLLIDLLGDLYATTWWIPVYTGKSTFGHWEGGIRASAEHEATAARAGGGGAAATIGALSEAATSVHAVGAAAIAVMNHSSSSLISTLNRPPMPKSSAAAAKAPAEAATSASAHLHSQHSHAHEQANTSRTGAPPPRKPKSKRNRRRRL